ncbi:MAG: NAD(P)H-hydrate dehydratase [Patescibacteria group bacterium]
MGNIIKKSDVQKIYPVRDTRSHKGQNGRMLIIGGSINYFGAPILAGLGALGSGADLVHLLVPECNFDVSRGFYADFIVKKYPGERINSATFDAASDFFEKVDCILIGPGVSENEESLQVITKIVKNAPCQIVLDAEAIPAIAQLGLPATGENPEDRARKLTITPHRGEMDEITEGSLPDDPFAQNQMVTDFAQKWGVTILLKNPHDIIAAPGKPTRTNETGNAGMTVGGSGDVLAGFTASLIAQHCAPYDACQCAAFLYGLAGDNLFNAKGYNFTATDLALELPYTIKSVIGR